MLEFLISWIAILIICRFFIHKVDTKINKDIISLVVSFIISASFKIIQLLIDFILKLIF